MRSISLFGFFDHLHIIPAVSNKLVNTKYTWLSFVPIVLFNQFKRIYNIYFLVVAISQFIEKLRVGFLEEYVGPLVFVILITIHKECYEDYERT